jgi:hypothetical protein
MKLGFCGALDNHQKIQGGMAEWFKAAVLKTVVRKYRGFESYSLRHFLTAYRSE